MKSARTKSASSDTFSMPRSTARSGDIDVVDTDAGSADDLEVFGARDETGRHLGRRPHREATVTADASLQLLRAETGSQIDLNSARGKNLGRARAQSIRNQHLRH